MLKHKTEIWRFNQVKIQLNPPKKMLQNVSRLILVGFSVLFNILKVYQSWLPENSDFSRWRPRWPPKTLNGDRSVTINSDLMIFGVYLHVLGVGARNALRQ